MIHCNKELETKSFFYQNNGLSQISYSTMCLETSGSPCHWLFNRRLPNFARFHVDKPKLFVGIADMIDSGKCPL